MMIFLQYQIRHDAKGEQLIGCKFCRILLPLLSSIFTADEKMTNLVKANYSMIYSLLLVEKLIIFSQKKKNQPFSAMSDDSSEDISDANIKKLIIVTPAPSNKRQFDRSGDSTSSNVNQNLTEEMEYGLRRYENELWNRKEIGRKVITLSPF